MNIIEKLGDDKIKKAIIFLSITVIFLVIITISFIFFSFGDKESVQSNFNETPKPSPLNISESFIEECSKNQDISLECQNMYLSISPDSCSTLESKNLCYYNLAKSSMKIYPCEKISEQLLKEECINWINRYSFAEAPLNE
jgi:hypothetical protein